jgi:hypothetical protein
MLRRVALVRTDVSKELSASIIRAIRIGELGCRLRGQARFFWKRRTNVLGFLPNLLEF